MRLGGPVFVDNSDPEVFTLAHKEKGYSAAYCPSGLQAGQAGEIRRFAEAMVKHDIVVSEVGAWCNPLSVDEKTSGEAVNHIIERLALADELGASVCVNIIGSRHESLWCGASADNFSQDFFDRAVDVYRKIIDSVKPTRTKMTFEIFPFTFLDGAEEYLRFLKALDREAAAVHFDPANCINCL